MTAFYYYDDEYERSLHKPDHSGHPYGLARVQHQRQKCFIALDHISFAHLLTLDLLATRDSLVAMAGLYACYVQLRCTNLASTVMFLLELESYTTFVLLLRSRASAGSASKDKYCISKVIVAYSSCLSVEDQFGIDSIARRYGSLDWAIASLIRYPIPLFNQSL